MWREHFAAPYSEDCPISGAGRSPPRFHRGRAGVRGPRFPSARARAVGPSEPAFAASAGGASPDLLLRSGNLWRLIAPTTKRMYLASANRRGRQRGQSPNRPAAALALDQLALGATSSLQRRLLLVPSRGTRRRFDAILGGPSGVEMGFQRRNLGPKFVSSTVRQAAAPSVDRKHSFSELAWRRTSVMPGS